MSTCSEIMVGNWPGEPPGYWTCVQREGHTGPHSLYSPSDGCTAWDDHCSRCLVHVCICGPGADG